MTQTDLHHATATTVAAAPYAAYAAVTPSEYQLVPLTGAVVLLAGIVIAVFSCARLKRIVTARSNEILGSCVRLAQQIEQLTHSLAATDACIAALAGRLDEQSRSSQGAAPTSYNVAIRLARSGASRQELMSTCGVTQQEADLVLRLHASDPHVRTAA
jgi:Protein of unknown function (DUF2802)